ncbi:MAG: hypothetical protein HYU02_06920 [Thaumarchaeota archaeon]|nr:hypothetical protein [Nitrososphaerota archaeon]
MERCWRYVSAIESSKREYLVEPFFLTILIDHEKKIRWIEYELDRLREEIDVWKKAGS